MGLLEAAIDNFLKNEPYRLVKNPDPNTNGCLILVDVRQEPDPMWSVIIGEIAHDLRSALDNLVWYLALKAGPRIEKRWRKAGEIQFPIYLTCGKFQNNASRRLGSISSCLQAKIEGCQPYKRFSKSLAAIHPLWFLHEISNRDKHRVLILTGVVLYSRVEVFDANSGGRVSVAYPVGQGLVEHDAVVLPLPGIPPSQVKVHADNAFHVGFGKGTPPEGYEVVPLLRRMALDVTEILDFIGGAAGLPPAPESPMLGFITKT